MRWMAVLIVALVLVRCGPGLCPFGGCATNDASVRFSRPALLNGSVTRVRDVPGGEGDIYVGGSFTHHQLGPAPRLIRLNSDGTVDSTFNVSAGGFDDNVIDFAIQTDGNLYVVGSFASFGGVGVNQVARLFPNGTLDTSFSPSAAGLSSDAAFVSISTGGEGDIYIGGNFNSYGATGTRGLVRLNDDGSLDTHFDLSGGFNGGTSGLLFALNGEIFVGGGFTALAGAGAVRVARLRTNGSLVTNFGIVGGDLNGSITKMAYAADGSGDFFLGGSFTSVGGVARNSFVRMGTDGSLDTSFVFSDGSSGAVFSITPAVDGTGALYLSAFSSLGDVIRVQSDGTVDSSFVGNVPAGNFVVSQAYGSSGLYVGGNYYSYNSRGAFNLVRATSDGSQDSHFLGDIGGPNNTVNFMSLSENGDIYLGGTFTLYRANSTANFTRLKSDGSFDPSFSSIIPNAPSALVFLSDGDLFLGGAFTSPESRIVRINSDGTQDTQFNPTTGFTGVVLALAIPSDGAGDIYAAGGFLGYEGSVSGRIVRIQSDASLDTHFSVGAGFNNIVNAMLLSTDGSNDLILGGSFNTYNGVVVNGLARLNSDASLDTNFNSGTGPDDDVLAIAFAPEGDGDLYVVGAFDTYNGVGSGKIVRVNSNGAFDSGFSVGAGFNGRVFRIVFDEQHRIYAVGLFSSFGGSSTNGCARLFSDGSLDTSFDMSTGFTASVFSGGLNVVQRAASGDLYFGGTFISYRDQAYMHLLRTDSNGNPN